MGSREGAAVGIVGFTWRCVFGDEPIDEVLDGGVGGVCGLSNKIPTVPQFTASRRS